VTLESILGSLAVEQTGPTTWAAPNVEMDYRRIFGGQLLAQAIALGAATTEGKSVKSLACLFPREGSMDEPFDSETNIADNEGALGHRFAVATLLRETPTFAEFEKRLASVEIGEELTYGDLGQERLRRNAELLFSLDPRTLDHWQSIDTMTAFLDVPVLQGLPGSYEGPVLFLSGDLDADSSCTERDIEGNLAQYPWADTERLSGMDTYHAMIDAPDLLAERVRNWLDRQGLTTDEPNPAIS